MHESLRTRDRLWDVAIAVTATCAALQLPVQWVFGPHQQPLLKAADWATSLIFAADLLVQWRRAGVIPHEGRRVSVKSLNWRIRGWLLLDALAAIPGPRLSAHPAAMLWPLAKLPRLVRMMRHWRQRAAQFGNQMRLVLFVFWMALTAHWLACGWAALRDPDPSHDPFTHYLYALYWCITTLATVGYGDVTPQTNGQMIYAMFVMIVGVGLFGYVIGNVAHWLANMDRAHSHYEHNLERLATFMNYRKIPAALQRRIYEYYAYLWENRLVYDESAVLSELPVPLQMEVSLILKRDFIQKVPFLRAASQQLIRDLSLELRPVVFMPGDYIFHAGEIARHMYFISRGAIEVIAADGHSILSTLREGDFFGEIALLFHQPRSAHIRAVEYCNLYALDKTTFERILSHHPEFATHIQAEAQRRREQPNSKLQTRSEQQP